jgi:hypothetical protein
MVLVTTAVFLLAAGCGSDSDPEDAADDTSTTPSYATELQALCDELVDQVVPITGDSARPTGAKWLSDRAKLRPIWDAFDAKVEKLEVSTADDREVADTFDALRKAGDAADAGLPEDEVAEMDATEFQSTFDEALGDAGFTVQRNQLAALGVECPAR